MKNQADSCTLDGRQTKPFGKRSSSISFVVFDSYASRIGRGTYKALERLQRKMRGREWFLKLDVCHYFDSIHHEVMLGQLHSLFKDQQLMAYFEQLIHGYHTTAPDRGLPIGNLTSQYFANHYLAVADHYVREQLHAPFAMRYMDDVLLLHQEPRQLLRTADAYRHYVEQKLRLRLHPAVMNRCRFGIPFLGYVVYGRSLRLNQRSRRRLACRLAGLTADLCSGRIGEGACRERMQALYAFAGHADLTALKRHIIDRQGLLP